MIASLTKTVDVYAQLRHIIADYGVPNMAAKAILRGMCEAIACSESPFAQYGCEAVTLTEIAEMFIDDLPVGVPDEFLFELAYLADEMVGEESHA
jgi:hypothetical protein